MTQAIKMADLIPPTEQRPTTVSELYQLKYPQSDPTRLRYASNVATQRLPGMIQSMNESRVKLQAAQRELGEIEQGFQLKYASGKLEPPGESKKQIELLQLRVITTIEEQTKVLDTFGREMRIDNPPPASTAAKKKVPIEDYQKRLVQAGKDFEAAVDRTRAAVRTVAANLSGLSDQGGLSIQGTTLSEQLTTLGAQFATAAALVKGQVSKFSDTNQRIASLLGNTSKKDPNDPLAAYAPWVEGSPAARAQREELNVQLKSVKEEIRYYSQLLKDGPGAESLSPREKNGNLVGNSVGILGVIAALREEQNTLEQRLKSTTSSG